MNRFGYTFTFLGFASAAFAFLNWFSFEPINTVGRIGFALTFSTMALSSILYPLFKIASSGANVQKLLVKINVPTGTPRDALPLIFGDSDLAIFKLLLEHGKLNLKKQTIKYEGKPVYEEQNGTFNVKERCYTPQLLKVMTSSPTQRRESAGQF